MIDFSQFLAPGFLVTEFLITKKFAGYPLEAVGILDRGVPKAVSSPLEKLTLAAESICAFEFAKDGSDPAVQNLRYPQGAQRVERAQLADLSAGLAEASGCLRLRLSEKPSDQAAVLKPPLQFSLKSQPPSQPQPMKRKTRSKNEKGKK